MLDDIQPTYDTGMIFLWMVYLNSKLMSCSLEYPRPSLLAERTLQGRFHGMGG